MKRVAKNLYRHDNGNIYYRFKIKHKCTWVSLRTNDLSDATMIASELIKEYVKTKVLQKMNPPVAQPVSSIVQPVQPEYKPISPPSFQKEYRKYLEQARATGLSRNNISLKLGMEKILIAAGVEYVTDINQEMVNRLLTEWRMKNLSESTMKTYKNIVMAFLNYCVSHDLIDGRARNKLKWGKLRDVARDVIIEPDHITHMIKYFYNADPDMGRYLEFLFNVGCRPAEAMAARVKDIDFTKGTFTAWMNKVGKEHVKIILDLDFVARLKTFCDTKSPDDYIFDVHPGSGRNAQTYSKFFTKFCKKFYPDSGYCLYATRHTVATRIARLHGDDAAAEFIGDDKKTAQKHYIHTTIDDMLAKFGR